MFRKKLSKMMCVDLRASIKFGQGRVRVSSVGMPLTCHRHQGAWRLRKQQSSDCHTRRRSRSATQRPGTENPPTTHQELRTNNG